MRASNLIRCQNRYAASNDAWAVGRARWNGGETRWFKEWIDEVLISGAPQF